MVTSMVMCWFKGQRRTRCLLKGAFRLVLGASAVAFFFVGLLGLVGIAAKGYETTGALPRLAAAAPDLVYVGLGAAMFRYLVMILAAVMVFLGAPYALFDHLEKEYTQAIEQRASRTPQLRAPGTATGPFARLVERVTDRLIGTSDSGHPPSDQPPPDEVTSI